MAVSTGQVLGIGAVLGLIGFFAWKKYGSTKSTTKTGTDAKAPSSAAAEIPRTLAPSNPYAPDSWEGAGYDLGYSDAAKDRSLGIPQNLSPEPPDVAYKQATDPYGLEKGYVEGYNYYWKMMTK